MKKHKSEDIFYFTEEEEQRFFKVVKKQKNLRDICLFNFILHYGLRLKEALKIQLKDFEKRSDGMRLFINRVKNGESKSERLMTGDITLYINWLKARSKFKNAEVNPYLFISRKSGAGMISEQAIQWTMLKCCEEAEIKRKKSHPHVLRHTAAVRLLMAGGDVYTVQDCLGHRNIASSMKYLKLSNPDRDRRLGGVREKAFSTR
jgi:integrase/recombinase XerD